MRRPEPTEAQSPFCRGGESDRAGLPASAQAVQRLQPIIGDGRRAEGVAQMRTELRDGRMAVSWTTPTNGDRVDHPSSHPPARSRRQLHPIDEENIVVVQTCPEICPAVSSWEDSNIADTQALYTIDYLDKASRRLSERARYANVFRRFFKTLPPAIPSSTVASTRRADGRRSTHGPR